MQLFILLGRDLNTNMFGNKLLIQKSWNGLELRTLGKQYCLFSLNLDK